MPNRVLKRVQKFHWKGNVFYSVSTYLYSMKFNILQLFAASAAELLKNGTSIL